MTATTADALSTAFYLLGPEAASDYVARNPAVAVLFVEAGVSGGPPRVKSFGVGDADFVPTVGSATWIKA